MIDFNWVLNPTILSLISLIISLISISFVSGWLWAQYYNTKLKKPWKTYFVIPIYNNCKLDYVEQDEKAHLTKELVLPSGKDSQILLWIKPKINYSENEYYFGCEVTKESQDVAKKPQVIGMPNPFILEGNLNPKHYRDWHQYYHVREERNRIKNEEYVVGFTIRTFEEGEYKANIYVHTPYTLGKETLKIMVQDKPSKEIPCFSYKTEKRVTRLRRKGHKKHNIKFIISD